MSAACLTCAGFRLSLYLCFRGRPASSPMCVSGPSRTKVSTLHRAVRHPKSQLRLWPLYLGCHSKSPWRGPNVPLPHLVITVHQPTLRQRRLCRHWRWNRYFTDCRLDASHATGNTNQVSAWWAGMHMPDWAWKWRRIIVKIVVETTPQWACPPAIGKDSFIWLKSTARLSMQNGEKNNLYKNRKVF